MSKPMATKEDFRNLVDESNKAAFDDWTSREWGTTQFFDQESGWHVCHNDDLHITGIGHDFEEAGSNLREAVWQHVSVCLKLGGVALLEEQLAA